MLVAHLSMVEGHGYFWGEVPAAQLPKRRGRPPKHPQLQPSPFNPTKDQLKQAVTELVGDGRVKKAVDLVAWLPSSNQAPSASSLLVNESAPEGKITLRPWRITALPLSGRQMAELLLALDQKQVAEGIVAGHDISYWNRALHLAGSLTARGRFVPDLKQVGADYRAGWEPVFLGDDRGRLANLAATMPDLCRALTTTDSSPHASAGGALIDFLRCVIDDLVRAAARATGQISRPSGRSKKKFASLHDRWLAALTSDNGLLEEDPDQPGLAGLAEQAAQWSHRISLLSEAPFRFCFRLDEPETDQQDTGINADGEWQVHYLLQAVDDPSLMVEPAELLRGKKRTLQKALGRYGNKAGEFALTALGLAAGLCPEVADSLREGLPTGFTTDTPGAYHFLSEVAPLLEQAGFVVQLPAWWSKGGTTAHLAVRGKASSSTFTVGGQFGMDQVLDFDWEVALGDETITAAELKALVKLKSPLINLRGQWVEVNAGEIRQTLRYWQEHRHDQVTGRQVVRLALGMDQGIPGLPLAGVKATGAIATVLEQLEGGEECPPLEPPPQLHATLRPYQQRGFSWLSFVTGLGLGACLADDMGLGKTIQTLTLLLQRKLDGERRPFLLVCPTSVIANWEKEASRFTPDLKLMIHHGAGRCDQETFAEAASACDLVITSYSLLNRDRVILQQMDWGGVILDEAQNIKNPAAKQSQAARSLKAGLRVALTGTPVENNVGDLWSIMEFLNPGFLGSRSEYKRAFLLPIQLNHSREAAAKLKRLTSPFILRRLKTDKTIIDDLPDKIEMKTYCNLTREQASLYSAIVSTTERELDQAEGIQRKGLILSTLTKLKEVCNHPAQLLQDNSPLPDRSGKLIRLTELCEEILSSGERALIFTQFAEMGEMLQRYLTASFGVEALFLHGGIRKKERDRMVELFQEEGGPPIFILSLKAGGTGLNLTRASHVIHFDRWWNPAVENQATDRAFRIGQVNNVRVHKFICRGTIEERIDEMIERKQAVAEEVVSGESWLTELSTGELKELLALRREALGDW